MPKSLMDWLGVISLWLGAAVIALKSGELPLPSWAPTWLASPWWAIAPLVLVSASVALFIARASKVFQPKHEPDIDRSATVGDLQRRPQLRDDDDPEGLTIGCGPVASAAALALLVMLLIWGIIAVRNRIVAEPLPTPPPVLQGPVTGAFVAETIKTKTATEAEAALRPYLGQSMAATGRIYSIRGERGYRLYIVGLTDPSQVPQVYLKFEGEPKMSNYNRQGHITANCKIERLDSTGIGLNECALIEAEEAVE